MTDQARSWGTTRAFHQGITFHSEGVDLYDDGKHLGHVHLGSKIIGLYRERRSYTSTSYQRKLIDYVHRTYGIEGACIVWF